MKYYDLIILTIIKLYYKYMTTYTFPSDDHMRSIYQTKNKAISFDCYYYRHSFYKHICDDANISFYKKNKQTIDINVLCLMNEYLENKLQILTYKKLYQYDHDDKRYVWYYEDDTKEMIRKVKECIKFIKKIK